jgi:hypothetical protein
LFRFGQFEEGIEPMDLAPRRGFAVLRECFQLSFYEFTEGTVFETFNDRSGSKITGKEHATARDNPSGFINLTQQSRFLHRRQTQRERPYRRSSRSDVLRVENVVSDAKP